MQAYLAFALVHFLPAFAKFLCIHDALRANSFLGSFAPFENDCAFIFAFCDLLTDRVSRFELRIKHKKSPISVELGLAGQTISAQWNTY